MPFASFEELTAYIRAQKVPGRLAVAAAADQHTLEAVLHAQDDGIAQPLLVGDAARIRAIYEALGRDQPAPETLFDVPDPAAACARAVSLIRAGQASFLMKGAVDTKVYLGAVVNRETGLGTGRLMSHFSILQVPGYHKLLVPVDGGMVPYPTLEQKKAIILNSVDVLHRVGYAQPKVGVLACVEKVNPKMPETVEAAQLAEMNARGEIPGCIVAGPISYDCAVSGRIAAEKGYVNPVAGDADILLAPNIHAGNILGKALTVSCGARMAGFIVGTCCPVVMTSRGASAEEKYLSIVLAAGVSR